MDDATRITSVDDVPDVGSHLFTVREADGSAEEVVLVRSADCDTVTGGTVDETTAVLAWKNYCQHETDQRLDRGTGVAMRDGELVCPKHGSFFDACSGYCDNGKAKGSTLAPVAVSVADGDVYLTDDDLTYLHAGGIEAGDATTDDDDDDMPGSTSHLSF
ncbi:Rieske (2Fe-2S) protein [Halomarina oriensis]|uniref:Rieske 2Fe-2S domain-containing protein n=1 Tax=Halomarina oriensis TaxID=671145 RepID=A0A6B0GNP0_9EURY|nr:Rieske 2Fe-2S domain-containing protein [Halomarina oriensis]MWG36404.1 Rieske 2Fe-2S domain-containing protein [Halomarina oriensis]